MSRTIEWGTIPWLCDALYETQNGAENFSQLSKSSTIYSSPQSRELMDRGYDGPHT